MILNALSIILFVVGITLTVFFTLRDRRTHAVWEKREKDVSRRMYELAILKELGDRVGYSLDIQQIVDVITNSLHQFIDYSAISYTLLEPDQIILKVHLEKSVNQKFVTEIKERMLSSLGALLDREFKKSDVKELISGAIVVDEFNEPVRSFFNIPLVIDDKVVGVLTVADTKAGLYKEEEMTILYKIIQQASKAVTSLQGVIKTEQAKVTAMTESMADGVVMTDTTYRILVANPASLAVIGQQAKKDVTIFDFIDNLGGKFDIRGRLEESVKFNKTFLSDEVLIRDKFYRMSVFPVNSLVKDQKEIVGGAVIFHDVTADRAIQKIREQFTSMIVHELRTPLSGINKISELLRVGLDKIDKKDFDEYIRLINADSNSMLELVNDILDLAKIEAGKFDIRKEKADIKQVIDNRIEFFKPSASDAKLELRKTYDVELPGEEAFDVNAIKQVLNNLISNAIKFTKAGGFVEVFVLNHKADKKISEELNRFLNKPKIKISDDKFGTLPNSVVVMVSDTGSGIGENDIKQLFNKFKQLDNRTETKIKGTGLGLAIAKGITEGHGGQIGVISESGMGSIFFFTIPL